MAALVATNADAKPLHRAAGRAHGDVGARAVPPTDAVELGALLDVLDGDARAPSARTSCSARRARRARTRSTSPTRPTPSWATRARHARQRHAHASRARARPRTTRRRRSSAAAGHAVLGDDARPRRRGAPRLVLGDGRRLASGGGDASCSGTPRRRRRARVQGPPAPRALHRVAPDGARFASATRRDPRVDPRRAARSAPPWRHAQWVTALSWESMHRHGGAASGSRARRRTRPSRCGTRTGAAREPLGHMDSVEAVRQRRRPAHRAARPHRQGGATTTVRPPTPPPTAAPPATPAATAPPPPPPPPRLRRARRRARRFQLVRTPRATPRPRNGQRSRATLCAARARASAARSPRPTACSQPATPVRGAAAGAGGGGAAATAALRLSPRGGTRPTVVAAGRPSGSRPRRTTSPSSCGRRSRARSRSRVRRPRAPEPPAFAANGCCRERELDKKVARVRPHRRVRRDAHGHVGADRSRGRPTRACSSARRRTRRSSSGTRPSRRRRRTRCRATRTRCTRSTGARAARRSRRARRTARSRSGATRHALSAAPS